MATAKKASKTYKCGNCGEDGHNARTCPKKGNPPKSAKPVVESEKKVEEASKPKEAAPTKVPIDPSQDLTTTKRTHVRDTGPGCFRCPVCNQAAVLVLVELPADAQGNHPKQLRCEQCHNKIPITKILIWGAKPSDAPK